MSLTCAKTMQTLDCIPAGSVLSREPVENMRALGVAVISVCSIGTLVGQSPADSPDPFPARQEASGTAVPSTGVRPSAWLYPVEALDRALPVWLQFGGEFRTRLESQDGIRYTRTSDTYVLNRFRFNVAIKPVKWLALFAETQDSRVVLNRRVPNALPHQNTWDIRQAYVELGT